MTSVQKTYEITYFLIDNGVDLSGVKLTTPKLKKWFNLAVGANSDTKILFNGVKITEMIWDGKKVKITLEGKDEYVLEDAINHVVDPDEDGNFPYDGKDVLVAGSYTELKKPTTIQPRF